jgi:hypothetical protein
MQGRREHLWIPAATAWILLLLTITGPLLTACATRAPSTLAAAATSTATPPAPAETATLQSSATPVPPTPSITATVAPSKTPAPPTPTEAPTTAPATPTITPPPTVTSTATARADAPRESPPASGPVKAYETSLTLQTYGYERALIPTEPDDAIYPYPRLDPEQVTPAEPQAYRAIVLENDYVALTILPELGGRIYRWIDKATGHHLLYENPVIKPTQWGYRGWWLAAGGIEWAFPVEEHGLNEWRPWTATINQRGGEVSVTVQDVEERTGMTVGATITLDADHNYVILRPWASNTTDTAQSYQYWLNAMLALGNNRVSKTTRFIIPADRVIIHSTGIEALPAAWTPISWPTYDGLDLSRYETWDNYLGFFVPNVPPGFVALYDGEAEQGVVRTFTPGWPAGTKFFGPGTLPPWLWTDDDSTYVELWSGATPTFADYATLEPGAGVSWEELWYPIHDLGGVQAANANAALHLAATETGASVGAAVTGATEGVLRLWAGGREVTVWELNLTPTRPFRTTWERPADAAGELGLTLTTLSGETLAQTGAVP